MALYFKCRYLMGIGFATLVYFAGIIGINPEYYESARMDGANRWQMATRVTIPSIMPLITIYLFWM